MGQFGPPGIHGRYGTLGDSFLGSFEFGLRQLASGVHGAQAVHQALATGLSFLGSDELVPGDLDANAEEQNCDDAQRDNDEPSTRAGLRSLSERQAKVCVLSDHEHESIVAYMPGLDLHAGCGANQGKVMSPVVRLAEF